MEIIISKAGKKGQARTGGTHASTPAICTGRGRTPGTLAVPFALEHRDSHSPCRDREDSGRSAQQSIQQLYAAHLPPKPCTEPDAVTHAPEIQPPLAFCPTVRRHGTNLHVRTIRRETLHALSRRYYIIGFAAHTDNESQSFQQPEV